MFSTKSSFLNNIFTKNQILEVKAEEMEQKKNIHLHVFGVVCH